MEDPQTQRLDGMTILRYAHAFNTGGGVEIHLRDLQRELGRRNRLTMVQMHLTTDETGLAETIENIGDSMLIKVPLLAPDASAATPAKPAHSRSRFNSLKENIVDELFRTWRLNTLLAHSLLRWRRVPARPDEPRGAGAKAAELLRRFQVDLVVLHTSGGADASEVIAAARAAGVPIALIHHYSNDLLGGMSLRQQIARVDAVGAASAVAVPAYLRASLRNLSDAVDLELYDPRMSRPVSKRFASPILYAPGRITPEKGQMDVLEVAKLLARRGLDATVVFAGRVDNPEFETRLRAAAVRDGLSGRVEFLGEVSLEEYRDWYGAAKITLIPTYHLEGMPRTLIDSQAMKVPPLVYDIGGTREGVKDRETGFLLRAGDVEGMARAAELLFRDPALHLRMADAGRAFVETHFSMQAFAARHEEFYLDVLEGRTAA